MNNERPHPQWIAPDWPAPANVRALITTRAGGVSVGPFGAEGGGGMNLGLKSGDAIAAVQANRARLRAVLPAEPRWLKQVHGAVVADIGAIARSGEIVRASDIARSGEIARTGDIARSGDIARAGDIDHSGDIARAADIDHTGHIAPIGNLVRATGIGNDGEPPEADAAITLQRDRVCVVSIADCMPVLFADVEGRAVGVAHAGWRGLAAGILQNTATLMRERLGDREATLLAYLGPAIGPAHFEVGAEVLDAMRERLPQAGKAFRPLNAGKYLCDLFALARQALAQVSVVRVFGGGDCTYSDAARFYSYRRDRVTGRHAAVIWLEE